jgi:hypothetical protein
MAISQEVAGMAREILDGLAAARAAAENLHGEHPALGPRLRRLLTMTASSTGPTQQARLMLLAALNRTEVSDEIHRGGSCHTGAERSVRIPPDADLDMLADALRQLAELSHHGR